MDADQKAREVCRDNGCEACQDDDPATTCYDRNRIGAAIMEGRRDGAMAVIGALSDGQTKRLRRALYIDQGDTVEELEGRV